MRLHDIMSTDVETVRPDASAEKAWATMRSRGIHHLVVTRGRQVLGVVSDRDLGGPRGATIRRERSVSDLMVADIVVAPPEATVRKAANLLRGRNLGCLPVVGDGKLVGIVTVSDLLELIGHGTERPITRAKRWTLRHHRGPRHKPGARAR